MKHFVAAGRFACLVPANTQMPRNKNNKNE